MSKKAALGRRSRYLLEIAELNDSLTNSGRPEGAIVVVEESAALMTVIELCSKNFKVHCYYCVWSTIKTPTKLMLIITCIAIVRQSGITII